MDFHIFLTHPRGLTRVYKRRGDPFTSAEFCPRKYMKEREKNSLWRAFFLSKIRVKTSPRGWDLRLSEKTSLFVPFFTNGGPFC